MERVTLGYRFDFGRDTSNILSILIHDGRYLTDISPFTQILVAVFLSIASTLAIYLLSQPQEKPKFNFWSIVAALPIGLSPYFIENLSYKFDSPYMALSVLCSILPLIFYQPKSKNYSFMITSFLCTLIVCTTYQASTGIFPAMVILLGFNMFSEKQTFKVIAKFILYSVLSYIAGIVFFKLFIMGNVDGYLNVGPLDFSELIPGVISHYELYFSLIHDDMRLCWVVAMLVILFSFIVTNICRTKQRKLVVAILSVVVLLSMIALSFGVYPLLQQPLFEPRAMYGFFTNFAFVAITTVNYRYAYVAKLSATYLAYVFVIFVMAYGNALSLQMQHVNYRIGLVANDLNEIYADNGQTLKVDFDGSIAYMPGVAHLFAKYPVLERLIRVGFEDNTWHWGARHFYTYRNLPDMIEGDSNMDKSSMKLIRRTHTHDIYQNGNNILIDLKAAS